MHARRESRTARVFRRIATLAVVLYAASPCAADCPSFTDLIGSDCTVTAWPGGRIPYQLDSSVTSAGRLSIKKAMKEWEAATGSRVFFEESATDPARVVIEGSGSCESGMPGKSSPGVRKVSWPAAGCPYAHEIGHVIGLYHEHQRMDRDRYVNLDTKTIACESYGDAVKRCSETTDANYGEYNTHSVMHYGFDPGQPCYMTLKNGTCVPEPSFGNPTEQDGSNVRELYASKEFGWKRFRSLGREVGDKQPLSAEIVPGVSAIGAPALTAQTDGSNNMFVRGSDGQLWHRFRIGAKWSEWFGLGGTLDSSPAAASWGPGSVIVVARFKNGKIGILQYAKSAWSAWAELSAPSTAAASGPALASRGPHKLDLFVRGKDNRLWWRSFNSLTDLPPTDQKWWSSWTDAGGQFVGDPAAASWGKDRIDVVVATTKQEVWHWAYANGEKSWDSIGCCSDAEVGPGIASRAANSLNVVMRGSDGQLWHQHWDGHWSGWSALGGRISSRPAIAATTAGRLDVVAIGTDKTLKHRSWGD